MKYIQHFLRLSLAFFFMFSALTKLMSFNNFNSFVETITFFDEHKTLIVSQIILAIELFIGFMLLLNMFTKHIYFLVLTFLIFMTFISAYLFFIDITNCHCFGDFIDVSPLASFIKNFVLIFFSYYLFRLENRFQGKKTVPILISLFLITLMFVFFNFNFKQNYFIEDTQKISKEQAINLLNNNETPIFIDVRTADQYNDKHIENAINIPFNESNSIEKKGELIKKWIGSNKLIIIYCDNRLCGLSETFAREFRKKYTYKNLRILSGGILHWYHE